MGTAIFFILIAAEAFFLIWNIISKKSHSAEKSVANLAEAALFVILSICGIIMMSFRYYGAAVMLAILTVISIIVLVTKKEREYKLSRSILRFIGKSVLIITMLFPALMFPQYKQPVKMGAYDVGEKVYAMVDESRVESFSESGEKRAVSLEVFYPENAAEGEKFPLVVFSHGAFGFSGSNYSTFATLASNGYIVASVNHPYHAFYDTEAYGRMVTVDPQFISDALRIQNTDNEDDEFKLSHEWLKLRVDDLNFVIDSLKDAAGSGNDEVLAMADTSKIGVFGHSLGGAAAAQLGRERDDIVSVIVVDGSLIGEELAFSDGKVTLNEEPYPVDMLDIFGEEHYNKAQAYAGQYANFCINKTSPKVQNVIFKNAGHLNFTDLPLFSPTLAKMLGVGTVNSRECIEQSNAVIMDYFDITLKGKEGIEIKGEY